MRKLLAGVTAVLMMLAAVAAGPVQADSGGPRYYLSLGDSLAAGTQPALTSNVNVPFTNESYTDVLYYLARADEDNLVHTKFGCPGETTVSMIDGGICSYDTGRVQLPATGTVSQLEGAIAFLKAHPGQVEFITIDIGANDVLACDPTDPDLQADGALQACALGKFAQVGAELPKILAGLRAAAPRVPIVGMNYYNPLLANWLTGPAGQALAQATTALFVQFNASVLVPIYTDTFGVPVADVTSAFQTTNVTPVDGIPVNVAIVCLLTWMCAPVRGPNIHPNRAGYALIAATFYREMLRHDILER